MKITYQDKTTRHDVFEQNFIMGSVFSIGLIFSFPLALSVCSNRKYSDEEKNRLQRKGALLGCLFLPSLVTVIGFIHLMRYYKKISFQIKKYGFDAERFKRVSGATDEELERYYQEALNNVQRTTENDLS